MFKRIYSIKVSHDLPPTYDSSFTFLPLSFAPSPLDMPTTEFTRLFCLWTFHMLYFFCYLFSSCYLVNLEDSIQMSLSIKPFQTCHTHSLLFLTQSSNEFHIIMCTIILLVRIFVVLSQCTKAVYSFLLPNNELLQGKYF